MIEKIKKILSLPKLKIEIMNYGNDEEILKMYKHFVKPHPTYKIFGNKTIGVMLYELPKDVQEYEKAISGKNGVAYFSRRCNRMGYYTKYFEHNEHLEELYNINTSTDVRQGRKMSEHYFEEVKEEEKSKNVVWFGVFNSEDILVGYMNVVVTPKLYIINQILGHQEHLKNNIMHLLLHDLNMDLIEKNKENKDTIYLMYDTFFGSSDGLKLYKSKHCFTPYRVKWKYVVKKKHVFLDRIYNDYLMRNRYNEYENLLKNFLKNDYQFICVKDHKKMDNHEKKHIIIRHDIDSDVKIAKKLFEIEKRLNIKSTYYFRVSTIDKEFMKDISEFGSEVGYHYEEIAQYCKDNKKISKEFVMGELQNIKDKFVSNIQKFEEIIKLESIAAHGEWVNREIKLSNQFLYKEDLKERFQLIEAYDIEEKLDFRTADNIYPDFWKKQPENAIENEAKNVLILIHPRWWDKAPIERLKIAFNRIIEKIKYK